MGLNVVGEVGRADPSATPAGAMARGGSAAQPEQARQAEPHPRAPLSRKIERLEIEGPEGSGSSRSKGGKTACRCAWLCSHAWLLVAAILAVLAAALVAREVARDTEYQAVESVVEELLAKFPAHEEGGTTEDKIRSAARKVDDLMIVEKAVNKLLAECPGNEFGEAAEEEEDTKRQAVEVAVRGLHAKLSDRVEDGMTEDMIERAASVVQELMQKAQGTAEQAREAAVERGVDALLVQLPDLPAREPAENSIGKAADSPAPETTEHQIQRVARLVNTLNTKVVDLGQLVEDVVKDLPAKFGDPAKDETPTQGKIKRAAHKVEGWKAVEEAVTKFLAACSDLTESRTAGNEIREAASVVQDLSSIGHKLREQEAGFEQKTQEARDARTKCQAVESAVEGLLAELQLQALPVTENHVRTAVSKVHWLSSKVNDLDAWAKDVEEAASKLVQVLPPSPSVETALGKIARAASVVQDLIDLFQEFLDPPASGATQNSIEEATLESKSKKLDLVAEAKHVENVVQSLVADFDNPSAAVTTKDKIAWATDAARALKEGVADLEQAQAEKAGVHPVQAAGNGREVEGTEGQAVSAEDKATFAFAFVDRNAPQTEYPGQASCSAARTGMVMLRTVSSNDFSIAKLNSEHSFCASKRRSREFAPIGDKLGSACNEG